MSASKTTVTLVSSWVNEEFDPENIETQGRVELFDAGMVVDE